MTAPNNFHPDFVAKLNDGRILVVEHKGKHLVTNENSESKDRIGKFWAEKTGNLFVMTTQDDNSIPIANQIMNEINNKMIKNMGKRQGDNNV